jgi:hypothetical protein
LLADLEGHPAETVIKFDGCADLGAVNLTSARLAVMSFCDMLLEDGASR